MQLIPGTKLQNGKYEIVRTLGQGGFGITYLARHTFMDRLECIKEFFVREYCDRDEETSQVSLGSKGNAAMMRQYMEKFMKEAKTVAQLDHPHIVKIHDVFKENNTSYAVMEYIDGCSLSEYVCDHGPLQEARAVDYICQVCEALKYAHERKVMHLDVKPSNIMISESGRKVTLIDFGMAKHYGKSGEQTSNTPVGMSHGYAPLEQYLEEGVRNFSPAADIYSLGATLYFLLTGERPAQANELAMQGGLKSIDGPFSKSVKDAIMAAMRFQKDSRPQSIDAFLKILDGGALSDKQEKTVLPEPKPAPKPISKPQLTSTQRTSPPDRGKPKAWLWALLACVAFAAIVSAIVLGGRKEKPTTGTLNGQDWVDLGLSVKWATCNIGASSPSDYGSYFAWGETQTKSEYTEENYKFRVAVDASDNVAFSKYNTDSNRGTVDNKKKLEMPDDAARQNWGSTWRMPTDAEWTELRENCSWTWTTLGGKNGYKVTSKTNGNSIFLPATGFWFEDSLDHVGSDGNYWSSSLYTADPGRACRVYFYSGGVSSGSRDRSCGRSVRPVTE